MSLLSARKGYVRQVYDTTMPDPETLTAKQVLERTITAVKKRKGLIHGIMINRHTRAVCALGAVLSSNGPFNVIGDHDTNVVNEIQEYNDSMPDATPKVRRDRVLAWLKSKLESYEPPQPA